MPSKKENVYTNYRLERQPLRKDPRPPVSKGSNLYPNLNAEKENRNFSSSEDSPEKPFPDNHSPRIPVKTNSPTSPNFMQDVGARRRSGKQQQKQINRSPDSCNQNNNSESSLSENSDMETDTNYPYKKSRETSENAQNIKIKKCLLPELDTLDNSTEARGRRLASSKMQSHKKTTPIAESNSNILLLEKYRYLILLIIIFFIIIFIGYAQYPVILHFIQSIHRTPYSDTSCINASCLVDSLRSEFRDQPTLTFRIIGSALKNVLKVQPNSPAIILLLATNGSETVCKDFALRLVDSLSVPASTAKISGENYKQANVNEAKMEIDRIISRTLEINQMGSVLIYDLDQISGRAAIIFHKYYDHENAPFKKAVFVMTINYNKPIDNYSDTKVWDKAANDHLHSVWADAGIDQISALLARLTVSVAVITTKTL